MVHSQCSRVAFPRNVHIQAVFVLKLVQWRRYIRKPSDIRSTQTSVGSLGVLHHHHQQQQRVDGLGIKTSSFKARGAPLTARRQNFTTSVVKVHNMNAQWGYWSSSFATGTAEGFYRWFADGCYTKPVQRRSCRTSFVWRPTVPQEKSTKNGKGHKRQILLKSKTILATF